MKIDGMKWARAAILLPVLLLGACVFDPDPQEEAEGFGDADLTVLFVGNSLTYTNGMPTMVQVIAEAAGRSFEYRSLTAPNFSLEDHWVSGARDLIADLKADVVVLQQGPSSLPENQIYLKEWTEAFAPVIRDAGGEPALYMVWPSRSRLFAFDDVRTSYLNAAEAVGGRFLPAGEAWRAVWEDDPDADLLGPDGVHPTTLGSFVAALTIYAELFEEDVTFLPATLTPTSEGLQSISLPQETAELIYAAVQRTVTIW